MLLKEVVGFLENLLLQFKNFTYCVMHPKTIDLAMRRILVMCSIQFNKTTINNFGLPIKLLLFLLISPGFTNANSISTDTIISKAFFQVVAQKGDGIYALMRRYDLDRYSCNFSKFYSLNQLKRNAPLFAGRKYLLPIYLYKFNGKTIRSSIGINDWDLAVSIQEYNEEMFEKQIKADDFRKDKELWVPFHKLNCDKPDLKINAPKEELEEILGEASLVAKAPSSGKGRKFDIFGPKYAYTPLTSNKLKGKVYYVVGGHGGPDPGAIGRKGKRRLCEDEYAYDVALRLCRNLVSHGATAYMVNRDPNDGIRSGEYLSCDEDEVLWGGIKMVKGHKERLTQRSDVINKLYEQNKKKGVSDQTLICIHVDSRTKGQQIDLFFYYEPGSKRGKKIAGKLQNTMKQKYSRRRNYKGTISPRDLHMLRETEPEGVYIELGNIRNTFDQQRILIETNRQALANWLFEGLIK